MGALHKWSLEPIRIFVALTADQTNVKTHLLSSKIIPLNKGKIIELTFDFTPARDAVEKLEFYVSQHPEIDQYIVGN